MSDPLQDLERKVRFPPLMGGNHEAITIPCSIVRRMICTTLAAQYMASNPVSADVVEQIDNDLKWLRDDVRAFLAKGDPS